MILDTWVLHIVFATMYIRYTKVSKPTLSNTFNSIDRVDSNNCQCDDAIIINQVLEISEDRKEELKLAKHSQTMVNVIEDFEHGKHGFYNYGKILHFS